MGISSDVQKQHQITHCSERHLFAVRLTNGQRGVLRVTLIHYSLFSILEDTFLMFEFVGKCVLFPFILFLMLERKIINLKLSKKWGFNFCATVQREAGERVSLWSLLSSPLGCDWQEIIGWKHGNQTGRGQKVAPLVNLREKSEASEVFQNEWVTLKVLSFFNT